MPRISQVEVEIVVVLATRFVVADEAINDADRKPTLLEEFHLERWSWLCSAILLKVKTFIYIRFEQLDCPSVRISSSFCN